MVSMGVVESSGALEALPRHGCLSGKAESASHILRLLKTQPQACVAALLDLRGAVPLKAGPRRVDQLMPVLTAPRIGWVAGITQKQLEQAGVRRLVHQYCHDYVTLPCASSLLGVVLGHAHGMAALSPDEMPCHSRNAGGDDMIGESAAMQAMQQMLQKAATTRSEEHTSELQSLMRISYAVSCLKKKNTTT